MLTRLAVAALSAAVFAPVTSSQTLIGVEWDGDVWSVDAVTGAGTQIGQTGFTNANRQGHNSMAIDPAGTIWVTYSRPGTTELFQIDPVTGTATPSGVQMPIDIRGLAFHPDGTMYALATSSTLYTIDPTTSTETLVGSTGLSVTQSLAWVNGTLFSWDLSQGLVRIDSMTGNATAVGSPNTSRFLPQFLTSDGQGNLLAGRDALYAVDVTTGVATRIGGNGTYTDLRGADLLNSGVAYGQGCAGSNGQTPELSGVGLAAAGNTFSLVVQNGLGNAPFAWGFGGGRAMFPLPGGCSLLINPPLVTATSALDAMGSSTLQIMVPTGLSGVVLNAQAVVVDPRAPGGGSLSATNGLEVTLR